MTVATEQLSLVTGVPRAAARTVATQVPGLTFTFKLVGQVIAGDVLSTTVTTCRHVVEFPDASVTVQVTVVFPKVYVVDG